MTQPTPILHVDMDAFFVSVELVRRPELHGLPVVVGGDGERGVVAAASYEARAYGVRSAMPSTRARRLCPDVVFLPGDHRHYGEVSRRVMQIFRRYTPLVEPLSLDEAFLDVFGVLRLHGPPTEVAAAIRSDVLAEEGLSCSVGIAVNKFLAKLASTQAKPTAGTDGPTPGRGVQIVPADGIREFLDPLPVEAIWGVGPRTLERLQRLGVRTVAELRTVPESTLVSSFGRAAGAQFWRLARGIDERRVDPAQSVRSIGHEETFSRDLTEPGDLRRELIRMVDAVGRRLREAGVAGRTVTVKVRFPDFTTVSRSQTLPDATDLVVEILEVATGLMESLDTTSGIRLLGVSLSGLRDGSVRQLRFEDLGGPGWLEAEQAVDRIRDRFGVGSIGPATTVGPEGLRPREWGDGKWGPED
ncbi:MAG: DNA polymerase IV [Actinomycetota bacterium]|nr:DNA polymerase IV [Actinomycetota bacterium]